MSEELNIVALNAEHRSMVSDLAKDGLDIVNELTGKKAHLWHMATGLMGEAIELLDAIELPMDMKHIVEELGDDEFFIEGFRQVLGIKREDTLGNSLHSHENIDSGWGYVLKMVRGMLLNSGELLDQTKKHVVYNKDINLETVNQSLCGLEYHLEGLRICLNITRGQTLDHNLNKLLKGDKARYKSGSFSNEQAQERADKN